MLKMRSKSQSPCWVSWTVADWTAAAAACVGAAAAVGVVVGVVDRETAATEAAGVVQGGS